MKRAIWLSLCVIFMSLIITACGHSKNDELLEPQQKKPTIPVKTNKAASLTDPQQTIIALYEASLTKDRTTFEKIIGNWPEVQKNIPGAMNELSQAAVDAGGVEKMKISYVDPADMLKDAKEMLDKRTNNNGAVVYMKSSKSHYVWILQKIDGNYYVVNGDDTNPTEFLVNPEKYEK